MATFNVNGHDVPVLDTMPTNDEARGILTDRGYDMDNPRIAVQLLVDSPAGPRRNVTSTPRRRPEHVTKTCAQCGAGFEALRKSAFYCSGRCRKAAQRGPETASVPLTSQTVPGI